MELLLSLSPPISGPDTGSESQNVTLFFTYSHMKRCRFYQDCLPKKCCLLIMSAANVQVPTDYFYTEGK